MNKIPLFALLIIGLTGSPVVAQQGRPDAEQLEQLRFERMKQALDLTDEQAEELRQAFQEGHQAHVEARARERAATDRLMEALRQDPVDQGTVERALQAVQNEREASARMREDRIERAGRSLTPEQRAKFLLFNQQFDRRLQELIARRQGDPQSRGLSGQPPDRRSFQAQQRDPGQITQPNDSEQLRRRVAELERRLSEIERGTN